MTDTELRKFRKELNAGTVSLVLLALLERAGEPMYGYQIAKRLEEMAGKDLPVKQGALYPVLRSLESQGLVASSVEPSTSGPPRRYYRPTDRGREALQAWEAAWRATRDFVDSWLEDDRG